MRKLFSLTIVVLVGGLLGACGADPIESPWETIASPTPTPTPTPTYGEAEQGAMDAVQAYIARATEIEQGLPLSNVDSIYEVADNPVARADISTWIRMMELNWHFEGAPSFTADDVQSTESTEQGQIYAVRGCYVGADYFIIDETGTPMTGEGRVERAIMTYTVLHRTVGDYRVLNETSKAARC